MTSARPSTRLRRWLPASLLRLLPMLALVLPSLLHAPRAMAADEPLDGGTFVTPGYAPGPATRARDRSADPVYDSGLPPSAAGGPTLRQPTVAGRRADGSPREAPPRRVEPPRPNEFQRFVEASTGRLLPIFGADFFGDPGEATTTLDNVPVAADYTVGPGDEIVVRAWGTIDVDYRSTVDRNGQLNLPKIGSFTVAGVKAADLERHLRAQIGRLYTNFSLSVTLGQLRAVKVFVVGPAQRPGVYTLGSQSTLLAAVAAAGGPGPNGSMRKITLRRDGRTLSELDVYQFLVQGDKSKDMQLAAGDVVVMHPVGARVAVNGALDNAAIYELKGREEPVREVLRYAGGAPVLANPNRAQLERVDPAQPRAARSVDAFGLDAAGLARPLRDGDVLTLLAISPEFANAVTLRGHVAQPLRHPWRPGMRISDLIPDREALITPGFYRRKNMLVQMLDPEDETLTPLERARARQREIVRDAGQQQPPPSSGIVPPVVGTSTRAGGSTSSDPARNAVLAADADRRRAGDADRIRRTPKTLFDALNWDYAIVERLNRADLTTQVISFNLGRAVLQGDPADNIELFAGDVVTIFGQSDIRVPVSRQARLVSIEGEVAAPGVYQLQPGETLKSLVGRAGGFTPQAYVYGLEFTREETRQRQRENLASAIARVEALAATQAARDAANTRNDQNAERTAAVSSAAAQAQLVRLSRIEPNGRIALELDPAARSVEELPDVQLDNADRISVPTRPGFVTVAGAVVNSNAFLWKPGRTAGDYLRLAGIDEAADPSNMFILRADGTVRHANERNGLFRRNGVESQPMQPGDALIMPNQLDFESWGRALIRNLKDFSQIFSGFGIGIAAINTLSK